MELASQMNSAELIFGIGAASAAPSVIGDARFIVVPDGFRLTSLEHLMPAPLLAKDATVVIDAHSFIALVNKRKTPATSIYFKEHAGVDVWFSAIIDDHQADSPHWRQNVINLNAAFSPEWETWSKRDGMVFSQQEFAQFIEDNLPDIAAPEPATMLEISRTFQAKKSVKFLSDTRLDNGDTQFTYEEATEAQAKGNISIPDSFTLGLRVLANGDGYQVPCRFRYSLVGPSLKLRFEIIRKHKIIEAAITNLKNKIFEECHVPMYQGQIA